MPYVGILRALGLAKETAVGTLNATPDVYLPYIPPETFSPAITTLESAGIRFRADKVVKATRGPAEVKGMKLKIEVEPENFGEILRAAFGQDTISGSASTGYTHTFERLDSAHLTSYSVWVDSGTKFKQFRGCMANKLDMEIKAKEFVTADTEWVGLAYDDTGTSKVPTYSSLKPFVFNHAVVKFDGSQVNDYDNLKIAIDNMVNAEHALNNDIYTAKIWSEGMRVTIDADLYLEDAVQWNKYLSGTTASFNVKLTGDEDISGATAGTKHTLEIDVPIIHYTAAPLNNPVGVLKVPFSSVARFDTSTSKTLNVALKNSRSSAY